MWNQNELQVHLIIQIFLSFIYDSRTQLIKLNLFICCPDASDHPTNSSNSLTFNVNQPQQPSTNFRTLHQLKIANLSAKWCKVPLATITHHITRYHAYREPYHEPVNSLGNAKLHRIVYEPSATPPRNPVSKLQRVCLSLVDTD